MSMKSIPLIIAYLYLFTVKLRCTRSNVEPKITEKSHGKNVTDLSMKKGHRKIVTKSNQSKVGCFHIKTLC